MTHSYFNIDTAAPAAAEAAVLLIYTGGTVGMAYDQGRALVPMKFASILQNIPELRQFRMRLTVLSLATPIDSSNVAPATWLTLVDIIARDYAAYDGFVVLHGTDTMAYSASALSFLLENLTKPVIFTGAQVPIGRIRTDARENLLTALELAAARHAGAPGGAGAGGQHLLPQRAAARQPGQEDGKQPLRRL